MTQAKDPRPALDAQLDRRDFLRVGAGAGGALLVIFGIPTLAKHFDLSGGTTCRRWRRIRSALLAQMLSSASTKVAP